MSDPRPFWEEVEAVFDPERPVQDPALFAERKPEYNPVATLERRLRRQSGNTKKYLLTGTVGNGKTSELFHVSSSLSQQRMVVFVDLWRHFQGSIGDPTALDRLEPWELIGLLGLAIYRAGQERFGHRWGDEPKGLQSALKHVRSGEDDGSPVEIDVVKLARGMAVAAGGVAGAVLGGPAASASGAGLGDAVAQTGLAVLDATTGATIWKWRVGLPGRRQRSDQEAEVRDVLHAVNRLILSLQHAYGRRLLLVVDGLDRVREDNRLRTLFVDSSLLGELACDALVTAPLLLRRKYANAVRVFETHHLSNVPVLSREDPASAGPGIGFFHAMVKKRLALVSARLKKRGLSDPPEVPLPTDVVDRMAYYSGGVARDFVRMVRIAAGEAWEARVEAVTSDIVGLVLREARDLKEALISSGEIELLEGVMTDPNHRLPSGEMALDLLGQQRLLPYPNETPWYYPHPLLTLALLKP